MGPSRRNYERAAMSTMHEKLWSVAEMINAIAPPARINSCQSIHRIGTIVECENIPKWTQATIGCHILEQKSLSSLSSSCICSKLSDLGARAADLQPPHLGPAKGARSGSRSNDRGAFWDCHDMTQHLSCLVVSCPIVACCLDGSILNTGASRGQEDDDDNTDLLELHFFPKHCPHWRVLTARVNAGVRSGYALWPPAIFL